MSRVLLPSVLNSGAGRADRAGHCRKKDHQVVAIQQRAREAIEPRRRALQHRRADGHRCFEHRRRYIEPVGRYRAGGPGESSGPSLARGKEFEMMAATSPLPAVDHETLHPNLEQPDSLEELEGNADAHHRRSLDGATGSLLAPQRSGQASARRSASLWFVPRIHRQFCTRLPMSLKSVPRFGSRQAVFS